MTRLPRVTGKQVIAALARVEFEVVRVRGSHHFLRHKDGRAIVVPVHSGETIGPGLMSKILRACDLTIDEFVTLLG
jgi:predicted RNA binding protein YcfA (HicA-like mRNA interferase family)